MIEPPDGPFVPEFWDSLYRKQETGWDIARPAPPLVSLLSRLSLPPCDVVVLGCGRGHEVAHLAACGHRATGVDFATSAVLAARDALEAADHGAEVLEADVFDLAHTHRGSFDLAVEHTCFCAIDPCRRQEYVQVIHEILRPGGRLAALFYENPSAPQGPPPFPASRSEIVDLFSPVFAIESLEVPLDSIERRAGKELLALMRRLD